MAATHPVYRFTSIGRPLDPSYPTNRVVVIVAPAFGLMMALLTLWRGGDAAAALGAGFEALLVFFGSWALARELDPDHEKIAFLAASVASLVHLFSGADELLLLFLTLFLLRIVNRSTGQPATALDSIGVLLFAAYASYRLHSPLLGIVAAIAFVVDALLAVPLRQQWVFALLSLAASIALVVSGVPIPAPAVPDALILTVVLFVTIGSIVLWRDMRSPDSVGDTSGRPLSAARMRGGLVIGLASALQSLVPAGSATAQLLWATLAGIAAGALWRAVAVSSPP